jgi:hypothetical protein
MLEEVSTSETSVIFLQDYSVKQHLGTLSTSRLKSDKVVAGDTVLYGGATWVKRNKNDTQVEAGKIKECSVRGTD